MQIFKPSQHSEQLQDSLKNSFPYIFHDLDIDQLNLKKHFRLIITQVLNNGTPKLIQLVFQIYHQEAIQEILKNPIRGVWFPRTYRAFCNLWNIPYDERAINLLYKRKLKNSSREQVRVLFGS